MALQTVTSRETLTDYIFSRLGEPVLEVNVDKDQVQRCIDDALQYYQEFHSDATIRTFFKHQVTDSDMANEYIPISSDIIFVSKLFAVQSTFGNTAGMFDVQYQFYLNNMGDFSNFYGDLAYLYQMEQYLSLIDMQLHGTPQVTFSRHQDRLKIYGDFNDGDINVGDYLVLEAYQILDPDVNTSIYNDRWIKDYSTSLVKEQWGHNMMKFDGMLLPGGITVNGRQLYDDAQTELERLREDIRLEQELPVDFLVG